MSTVVKCPVCERAVPWVEQQLFRPFCSERCKLIDLGEWATESYKIPVEPSQDDGADDEGDLHGL